MCRFFFQAFHSRLWLCGLGFATLVFQFRLRDLRRRIFQLHLRDLRLRILRGFGFEGSASRFRLHGIGRFGFAGSASHLRLRGGFEFFAASLLQLRGFGCERRCVHMNCYYERRHFRGRLHFHNFRRKVHARRCRLWCRCRRRRGWCDHRVRECVRNRARIQARELLHNLAIFSHVGLRIRLRLSAAWRVHALF